MHIDVRTPLGALFLILGVILIATALATHASVPPPGRGGEDANLHWGLGYLAFGAAIVWAGRHQKRE